MAGSWFDCSWYPVCADKGVTDAGGYTLNVPVRGISYLACEVADVIGDATKL